MKARINQKGNLEIWRGRNFKVVECPFSSSGETICGDWCALFSEPIPTEFYNEVVIRLCKKDILVLEQEFEDGRLK